MITKDEWLKALADVELRPLPADEDALSLMEFQTLLGIGRSAAKRRLDALVRDGKAACGKKLFKRSDGAVVSITAYRLLKESADS